MNSKFNFCYFSINRDSGNGSNITFNRFLNSTNHQSDFEVNNPYLNPVISSEDEQINNRNLRQLIELDLKRSRKSTKKERKVVRPQASFVCLGIKGKSDRKKKRFENGKLRN